MDHVELDTAPDSVFVCTHHNYDVSVGATAIRLTTKNTNDLPPFAEFKLSFSTESKSNIHLGSVMRIRYTVYNTYYRLYYKGITQAISYGLYGLDHIGIDYTIKPLS